MYKKILLLFFVFISISLPAVAGEYDKVTDNPKIIKALELMKESPAKESYEIIMGKNPTNKAVKIEFWDKFSEKYKQYFALGVLKKNQLFIYINSKHEDAPPEALCALIAGRAFNYDVENSINEEVYSATMEAVVWDYFLQKNPSLGKDSSKLLVKRENILNNYYKKSSIDYLLFNVYKRGIIPDLPKESPGFTNAEFQKKIDKLLKDNPQFISETSAEPAKTPSDGTKTTDNSSAPVEKTSSGPIKISIGVTQAIDPASKTSIKLYKKNLEHLIESNCYLFFDKNSRYVVVSFRVAQDGRLMSHRIEKSSGSSVFDQAVIKAIEDAAPFKPLPKEFKEQSIGFKMKFDYNLYNAANPSILFYEYELKQQIISYWVPPRSKTSRNVTVYFKIAKDGTLMSSRVEKSSGSSAFDQSAIKAIEVTAPFKPLPTEIQDQYAEIKMTFNYNVRYSKNNTATMSVVTHSVLLILGLFSL